MKERIALADVDAHLFGGVLEPDGVALGLVHLLAALVAYQCVAEQRAKWRAAVN